MFGAIFSSLIKHLQCSNSTEWPTILKDVAAAIHSATEGELQELLELLTSTYDLNIQIKLISVLSSYILSNGLHYEVIVKYSPLYETVQDLIMRGLPLKSAIALNFISALLCFGDSRQTLIHYAQHRIRVSGCLNTMCDIFIGSMMYQDSWVALCRSLAESCHNSEVNQHYCSHLIPLCLQRCREGTVDVFSVLQSLLQNNKRNIQLFLANNGLDIFTRQLLQNNTCIQLLHTITEKSPDAVTILRESKVVHHLQDFLRLYGPYSQMGQWSAIILFHLDAQSQLRDMSTTNKIRTQETGDDAQSNNNIQNNGAKPNNSIKLVHRIGQNIHPLPQPKSVFNINSKRYENITNTNMTSKIDPKDDTLISKNDTANLFRNVIKEVVYWKVKSGEHLNSNTKSTTIKNQSNIPFTKPTPSNTNVQRSQANRNKQNMAGTVQDLSFSFLYKDSEHARFSFQDNGKLSKNLFEEDNLTTIDKGIQTDTSEFYKRRYNNDSLSLADFKPPFISTPKRLRETRTHNESKISSMRSSRISLNKKTTNKTRENLNRYKEVKNQSISTRFFNVINESCTTFVKSVKSIFKANQNKGIECKQNANNKDESQVEDLSCSYSFTNYMRTRDNRNNKTDHSAENSSSDNYKLDSCKTCKDTVILQEKMAIDDQLKRTVKRLKHGLNLYGCDFKKICKMMWPRNQYMTPEILYDLYRKLIINGGHGDHDFRYKAHNILRKRHSSRLRPLSMSHSVSRK